MRRTVRRAAQAEVLAPPGVTARVLAALDEADRGAPGRAKNAPGRRLWAPALGLAAAAVIATVLWVGQSRVVDPISAAEKDLASYSAATLALEHVTTNPQELERFFTAGRIDFAVRVFDFDMMAFTLRGGSVHRIAGRPSALFAYSSADGRHIVCQMYQGSLSGLPQGFERHILGGIEFRLYRRGEHVLVFWQEGALVCVLAFDGDSNEALELARAKAKAGT